MTTVSFDIGRPLAQTIPGEEPDKGESYLNRSEKYLIIVTSPYDKRGVTLFPASSGDQLATKKSDQEYSALLILPTTIDTLPNTPDQPTCAAAALVRTMPGLKNALFMSAVFTFELCYNSIYLFEDTHKVGLPPEIWAARVDAKQTLNDEIVSAVRTEADFGRKGMLLVVGEYMGRRGSIAESFPWFEKADLLAADNSGSLTTDSHLLVKGIQTAVMDEGRKNPNGLVWRRMGIGSADRMLSLCEKWPTSPVGWEFLNWATHVELKDDFRHAVRMLSNRKLFEYVDNLLAGWLKKPEMAIDETTITQEEITRLMSERPAYWLGLIDKLP